MSAYPFISASLSRAAEAADVSESTIKTAIADGSLTAHYVGARSSKPVIRAADLDEWVQSLPTSSGRKTSNAA